MVSVNFIIEYFELEKEKQRAIENRQVTLEQLWALHEEVDWNCHMYWKLSRKGVIICAVIVAVFLVGGWISPNCGINEKILLSICCPALSLFMFLLFRYGLCPLAQRQFVRCLRKGYPELADIMGKGTFKWH